MPTSQGPAWLFTFGNFPYPLKTNIPEDILFEKGGYKVEMFVEGVGVKAVYD